MTYMKEVSFVDRPSSRTKVLQYNVGSNFTFIRLATKSVSPTKIRLTTKIQRLAVDCSTHLILPTNKVSILSFQSRVAL